MCNVTCAIWMEIVTSLTWDRLGMHSSLWWFWMKVVIAQWCGPWSIGPWYQIWEPIQDRIIIGIALNPIITKHLKKGYV